MKKKKHNQTKGRLLNEDGHLLLQRSSVTREQKRIKLGAEKQKERRRNPNEMAVAATSDKRGLYSTTESPCHGIWKFGVLN